MERPFHAGSCPGGNPAPAPSWGRVDSTVQDEQTRTGRGGQTPPPPPKKAGGSRRAQARDGRSSRSKPPALDSELLVLLSYLYRWYSKKPVELSTVQRAFVRIKCSWVKAGRLAELVEAGWVGTREVELDNGKGDLVPTPVFEITDQGKEIAAEYYRALGMARPTFPYK